MDTIIRGTNATIQIKIKEDLDFSTITALELHIYQPTHPIVKTLQDERGTIIKNECFTMAEYQEVN